LTLVAAKAMRIRTAGGRSIHAYRSRKSERRRPGHITGYAEPFTLVVDRPTEGGGRGLGFNGGQLLYLAVAGCISNDLFREARAAGIELSSVRVKVSGDFVGEPAVSDEIQYEVEVAGNVPDDQLQALINQVDEIAEIPNSLRQGTRVRLVGAKVRHAP
jgi:putative redox protein